MAQSQSQPRLARFDARQPAPDSLRHRFNISPDMYFTLKELASIKKKGHVTVLVQEIFQDYIEQHKDELV